MLETYVVHITRECNMDCVYCYEKDKTSQYTFEEIRQLLDSITSYNKHFNLEFLGGEPCLRIDLIRSTIEYLEAIPDVNVEGYTITTNGTIINTDLVDLLKGYPKVRWAASIDGNKFMNSLRLLKTGENSYDTVVTNFKQLHKELFGDRNRQLSVHLVTHPFNIGYYVDGIIDLYNHGVRSFGIGTVESTVRIDKAYCDEFIQQHKILSDMLHEGQLPGINIGLFNGLKPKTDERHYIRDDTGKVILETYGRAKNDIKDTEQYKTSPASSDLGDMIYDIREAVYKYHNRK